MAGTIVADTLTHSTAGSLTTDYVVNGSAKAFLVGNQGTATALKSLNVSSYVDAATGNGETNFTNSMDSSSFSVPGSHSDNNSFYQVRRPSTGETTSSKVRVRTYDGAGSANDDEFVSHAIFGDLA